MTGNRESCVSSADDGALSDRAGDVFRIFSSNNDGKMMSGQPESAVCASDGGNSEPTENADFDAVVGNWSVSRGKIRCRQRKSKSIWKAAG